MSGSSDQLTHTREKARQAALRIYGHENVRDRYDADLLMAGFVDGAMWAYEGDQ